MNRQSVTASPSNDTKYLFFFQKPCVPRYYTRSTLVILESRRPNSRQGKNSFWSDKEICIHPHVAVFSICTLKGPPPTPQKPVIPHTLTVLGRSERIFSPWTRKPRPSCRLAAITIKLQKLTICSAPRQQLSQGSCPDILLGMGTFAPCL